jgi:hypothetical protein
MNYLLCNPSKEYFYDFYFSLKKNTGSLQAQYRITERILMNSGRVLSGNHLIVMMMLVWALPPPLWHSLMAIMPYYLYVIREKFPI